MGEHDHMLLQFRAVAAQHADPSGMEQSSEIWTNLRRLIHAWWISMLRGYSTKLENIPVYMKKTAS